MYRAIIMASDTKRIKLKSLGGEGMRSVLVQERKNRRLTRKEVSKALELAEVTIRKLEEGSRDPSIKTAGKLSLFYNKRMEDLFPDIFLHSVDTKRINKTT